MTKLTTILFLLMCLNGYGQTLADFAKGKKWVTQNGVRTLVADTGKENAVDSSKLHYFFVSFQAGEDGKTLYGNRVIILDRYPSFGFIKEYIELICKHEYGFTNNLVIMSLSEISFEYYKALYPND